MCFFTKSIRCCLYLCSTAKIWTIYRANQSKAKSNDDEDDEEINLATFDNSKEKKKGKWKKKGFEGSDDDQKCKHCSRKGHPADKCWMLDKNKGNRPEWFDPEKYCQKKEKEVSNAAVSNAADLNYYRWR
jgi:hypothetical protein